MRYLISCAGQEYQVKSNSLHLCVRIPGFEPKIALWGQGRPQGIATPGPIETMTQQAVVATDFSFATHLRLASDADRARLIQLINSAYAIESFFEGTRTDEERLAEMMLKGKILVAEDDSGRPLACVYTEVRAPAVT